MTFNDNVTNATEYMNSDRFSGITRLYSARQVAEQQGTIESGYPVARRTVTKLTSASPM